MPTPTVSVIIPAYNAADYLESAIASVQAQTFSDFEIVVVNDGSKDRTKPLLDALATREPRLRVISRPNTGIVGALNDCLAAARGEFVARMDADDLCLPERFARQVDYLRTHPDCICVGSEFIYMDAAGFLLKTCSRPTDHATIERELLSGNGGVIVHPAAMFRRAAIVGWETLLPAWVEKIEPRTRTSSPVRYVVRMVRHIVENIADPLSAEDVAAVVGLHPNYAANLFAKVMHISIQKFIVRMRLIRARSLLFDGSLSVSNIAFQAGFGSQTQFYDHFRRAYGMTPNQMRRDTIG